MINSKSNSEVVRNLVGLAAFTVMIWGLAAAQEFFVPLCLAALLSFAMAPAVRVFRRYNFPEWLSVLLAALLVVIPLGALIYFAVAEIQMVVTEWPKIFASLKEVVANIRNSAWAHRLNLSTFLEPHTFSEKLGDMAGSGAMVFLGGMLTALSAGTTFVLIIFFAVMMLASRIHLTRAAKFAFQEYGDGSGGGLLDDITDLIETFLIARFGITVISAAACWITLVAFGIPYSFLIALFYGLMTWVPVIGFAIALAPSIVVAIAVGKSTEMVLAANLILLAVWIVQDHILQPKWLGSRLKLNFFATYLALFVGEHIWGAWGMFLSVPLLGVLRIVFTASKNLRPIAFAMSEEEFPEMAPKPMPNSEQF